MEREYGQYAYPGKKIVDDGVKLLRSVLQYTAPLEFFKYISKQRRAFMIWQKIMNRCESFLLRGAKGDFSACAGYAGYI